MELWIAAAVLIPVAWLVCRAALTLRRVVVETRVVETLAPGPSLPEETPEPEGPELAEGIPEGRGAPVLLPQTFRGR